MPSKILLGEIFLGRLLRIDWISCVSWQWERIMREWRNAPKLYHFKFRLRTFNEKSISSLPLLKHFHHAFTNFVIYPFSGTKYRGKFTWRVVLSVTDHNKLLIHISLCYMVQYSTSHCLSLFFCIKSQRTSVFANAQSHINLLIKTVAEFVQEWTAGMRIACRIFICRGENLIKHLLQFLVRGADTQQKTKDTENAGKIRYRSRKKRGWTTASGLFLLCPEGRLGARCGTAKPKSKESTNTSKVSHTTDEFSSGPTISQWEV